MDRPEIPCPNCGNTEWTPESNIQSTRAMKKIVAGHIEYMGDSGLAFNVFKCKECHYAMFFYNPL